MLVPRTFFLFARLEQHELNMPTGRDAVFVKCGEWRIIISASIVPAEICRHANVASLLLIAALNPLAVFSYSNAMNVEEALFVSGFREENLGALVW
jgi:hypothetical protein